MGPIKDCGERLTLRILAGYDPGHMVRASEEFPDEMIFDGDNPALRDQFIAGAMAKVRRPRTVLTGGRGAGKTTAVIQHLGETVTRLERALRQWMCPVCHGKGTTDHPRWVGEVWTEGLFPCTHCRGTGLHPTAAKALGELVDAQPPAEGQPNGGAS